MTRATDRPVRRLVDRASLGPLVVEVRDRTLTMRPKGTRSASAVVGRLLEVNQEIAVALTLQATVPAVNGHPDTEPPKLRRVREGPVPTPETP